MARVIWKRTWSLSGKWDTMDWQKSHQNWSEPADVEAGLAWPGRPWGSSRPGRPAARRGRAGWAGGEQSCALRLGEAQCKVPRAGSAVWAAWPGRKRWAASPAHLEGRREPGMRCCAPIPAVFPVCVPAPLPAAPPGPGAAGAPLLPRSDTRWRRAELQRPRQGPGSSLMPGLRVVSRRQPGFREAVLHCRAVLPECFWCGNTSLLWAWIIDGTASDW